MSWCKVCEGMLYNDGCKTCDPDYLGTLLVMAENEITCCQHAKDLEDAQRHLSFLKELVDEMWELHPHRYYNQLVWELP